MKKTAFIYYNGEYITDFEITKVVTFEGLFYFYLNHKVVSQFPISYGYEIKEKE